jgi:adenine-specific DNA-methyltransferase
MSEEIKIKELEAKVISLEAKIKELKDHKNYGLIWEPKIEKFDKESKDTLPILREKGKDFPDVVTDKEKKFNILIEGDNYHTLSILSYTHRSKVDLIYIDPPYNTGNKDFTYNDHYVDGEDRFRHSKWLSFMEKRLKLAKTLLKKDGVIFISIDDNEYARLKLMCEEIFGEDNLETIIWHKVADDSGKLKITHRVRREHEYILICYKNKKQVFFKKYLSDRNYKNEYTNPDNDPRGHYKQGIISTTEEKSISTGKNFYTIKTPAGKEVTRQWRFSKENFQELNKDNRIYYGKDGLSIPSLKVFINEQKETTPTSIFSDLGTAKTAGFEIENIFGNKPFSYPKPLTLIEHIVKIASDKDDLILDFMAGSGTTGHAVLGLNKKDHGDRHFILCTNNEKKICESITFKRLEKVMLGYKDKENKKIEGLGSNLKYLKTDFVKLEKSIDTLKSRIVDGSTEIICLKDNSFDSVLDNYKKNRIKIFQNKAKYTAILFDLFYFDDFVNELKKLKNKPVSVYVFSYAKDFSKKEFGDLDIKFTIEPIPENILETYKKIFNF